jgi:hypothetical protein
MIELAAAKTPRNEIQYTGMDLFEARSDVDGPGVPLKTAYQTLRATGARVRLLPGDPLGELVRVANALGTIDLLIVSAGLDTSRMRAWWFVPRLLHDRTQVCLEERSADGVATMHWKTRAEIDQLASAGAHRRAA